MSFENGNAKEEFGKLESYDSPKPTRKVDMLGSIHHYSIQSSKNKSSASSINSNNFQLTFPGVKYNAIEKLLDYIQLKFDTRLKKVEKLIKKNLRNLKKAKKKVKKIEDFITPSRKASAVRLHNDDFRFFREMVFDNKGRMSKSSPVKRGSKSKARKKRGSSLKRGISRFTGSDRVMKKIKYLSKSKERSSLRKIASNLSGQARFRSNERANQRIVPIHLEDRKKEVGDFILMPKRMYKDFVSPT